CIFFFCQAEDGIRYWSVTGVQTCALPISAFAANSGDLLSEIQIRDVEPDDFRGAQPSTVHHLKDRAIAQPQRRCQRGSRQERVRSEERRVGKRVERGGRRSVEKEKKVEKG